MGFGTFGNECNRIKDEIKHALNNEVIDHYDSDGKPVYIKADKKETNKLILDKFDFVVYEALQAMASGRALDRLLREKVGDVSLQEYIKTVEEENLKYQDYKYENQELNSGQIVKFPKGEIF